MTEIPPQLCSEAAARYLLLRHGIHTTEEIVAWADEWIERLDDLPEDLIDVSLSGSNWNELFSALNRLACPLIEMEEFRMLCRILLARLEAEGEEALFAVSGLLAQMEWENDEVRPQLGPEIRGSEQVGFLGWFAVQAELTDAGIVEGTLEDVQAELLAFLREHA